MLPATLVISATEIECSPILKEMTDRTTVFPWLFSGTLHQHPVEVLVSGIGSVATTFRLTQTLMQRPYHRALSIGIAGSFEEHIPIGEVVQITEDCFADLGIDDNGTFLSLFEAGLGKTDDPLSGSFMINPSPTLLSYRHVRGITVQTTSGNKKRIDELAGRYHPQIETMENAAFFYVCQTMQLPFTSYRAVSNKIEPRNLKNWRIAEAIAQVNRAASNFFKQQNKM